MTNINVHLRPSACMTLLLLAISSLFSATEAGGCGGLSPPFLCGEVDNQSSHVMYYTTVWGNQVGEGEKKCNAWNSQGGAAEKPGRYGCTPQPTTGHEGGWGVDVDAFTFIDQDYEITMGDLVRIVKKGVWTRVQSHQEATCSDGPMKSIQCEIEWDV